MVYRHDGQVLTSHFRDEAPPQTRTNYHRISFDIASCGLYTFYSAIVDVEVRRGSIRESPQFTACLGLFNQFTHHSL